MRLPIIKHINGMIDDRDPQFVEEMIHFLEEMSEARGLKDDELDLIGELISNMYGALEVNKAIKDGVPQRDALNGFMQRVIGSIDQ